MAHDFIDIGKSLKEYEQAFSLSPVQWGQCATNLGLQWTTIRFTPANRSGVPKKSGLYAFTISPSVTDIFAQHYLMYIGQAGAESGNTLYARYQDYITPSKVAKRPRIKRLMDLWDGYIWYSYVAIDPNIVDLKATEVALNDALVPPCVSGDFSIEIRKAVRAWK